MLGALSSAGQRRRSTLRITLNPGNTRRSAVIAAGLTLALSTGCSDEEPDVIAEGDAHFVARFAGARPPTGRLIGWNLGRGTYYAPERDALHPEWRTPERVAAAARLRLIAAPGGPAPYVRFSGLQIDGTLGGDGYHFWDFARPGRPPLPTDNMAGTDYGALSDEIGGELSVTLNFGSGTAAEAAEYVRYLTGTQASDPLVSARIQAGRAEPYAVDAFEIGNEVYGFWNTAFSANGAYAFANPGAVNGGDPAWSGKPASNAADFAARALEYVRAVQAVLPDARFRVPLSQATMDAWGGLPSALSALRPLLIEPAVDAVVVHFYKADDALTLGLPDVNEPEFMLSGSELFRPRFAELRTRLGEVGRAQPLAIAVTEYHVADAFARGKFLLGDTAAVGLGLADMLVFFSQLGIEHACQHLSLAFGATQDLLIEPWYNPFLASAPGELLNRPAYTVTRLFASHLLPRRAQLIPTRAPQAAYAFGEHRYVYDRVHATAFASDDGREGTIFLLQRDLQRATRVTFDVDPGFTVTEARAWSPTRFDEDASLTEIPVLDARFRQRGRRIEIAVPAHSIMALRLRR